jgi:cytochrome P450/nitrite reductase/ring-hydroxylating ferredoxin subunit
MKHYVALHTEIIKGQIFEKTIGKHSIIFVRDNDTIKAYSSKCPHQGANLAGGHIEDDAIVCPLHQRKYACKNGYDSTHHVVLTKFDVVIENGSVFIMLNEDEESKPIQHVKSLQDLPQPKGVFLLGNLPKLKANNKPRVIEEWVKECGDIFRVSLMGKKLIISADPEFNIQLYKNRPEGFRRYGKIDEIMSEMGIKGVFNVEGDQWKIHRKLTAEALNAKNVNGFFNTLKEVTERLYNRWIEKSKVDNYIVDIQKELMLYTTDITTQVAFGYDSQCLMHSEDALQQHLEKIFPMINKRTTSPFPTWRFLKSKEDKALDNALLALKKTMLEFIQKAKDRLVANPDLKDKPENFLQALLVEQEKSGSFSDDEIFGNVFTLLLAGEDTTSNTISWTLYYLLQNPEVYAKIKTEIDTVLQNDTLLTKENSLQELKYTEAVAMESMRICPVTPMLFLESLQDQVVKGYQLKKGTRILMQSRIAQKKDAHFSDAASFIPERWLEGNTCPVHQPDIFRTFGAGPRFCPGKNLAMHEIKMALAMILHNFDLSLAVTADSVNQTFAFTLFPENLMVKIKAKSKEEVSGFSSQVSVETR